VAGDSPGALGSPEALQAVVITNAAAAAMRTQMLGDSMG
jgi:hypothetical protein